MTKIKFRRLIQGGDLTGTVRLELSLEDAYELFEFATNGAHYLHNDANEKDQFLHDMIDSMPYDEMRQFYEECGEIVHALANNEARTRTLEKD